MAMQMKLNKEEYLDKVLGCWIGKNIGGTMGGPFEGRKEMVDITGYTTPKGEPLPNDDLDLQLVWLQAVKEIGAKSLNANILADYWLSYISPHFNEYGINKSNLEMGLLPPLSGEVNNIWKQSNGAWIRSEIWACLAPGVPNIAINLAIMDAMLDHGLAEGTYAEMFMAALQSMAFFENDLRKLINEALSYIPADCRIARSINIVLDGYDNKVPWQEVRQMIVKDSEDLGFFQAPANIAYVVLGLIYGEGDFKKSMIYSINCADDTDCTGGTCGAVLGIIYGAKNIPEDWKEYIGDRIATMCINASYLPFIPQTCTDLVERVAEAMPHVLYDHNIVMEFTDGKSDLGDVDLKVVLKDYNVPFKTHIQDLFKRSPYSFEIPTPHTKAIVEYPVAPFVKPNGEFEVKISLKNFRRNSYYYEFNVALPEGWTADYNRTCHVQQRTQLDKGMTEWVMKINVGERVEPINRIQVMVSPKNHAIPIMVPIVLLG